MNQFFFLSLILVVNGFDPAQFTLSTTGKQFQPANPIESLAVLSNTRTTASCAMCCYFDSQCRTFDFDSNSQQCRLFEGSVDTGTLVSTSLLSSVVGWIHIPLSVYDTFNASSDECINNRFLNGSMCLNQRYTGEVCQNNNWCRTDLNTSCIVSVCNGNQTLSSTSTATLSTVVMTTVITSITSTSTSTTTLMGTFTSGTVTSSVITSTDTSTTTLGTASTIGTATASIITSTDTSTTTLMTVSITGTVTSSVITSTDSSITTLVTASSIGTATASIITSTDTSTTTLVTLATIGTATVLIITSTDTSTTTLMTVTATGTVTTSATTNILPSTITAAAVTVAPPCNAQMTSGGILFSVNNTTSSSYPNYTCYAYTWIGTGSPTTLSFFFRNDAGGWLLDDVSVYHGSTQMIVDGGYESGSLSAWIHSGACDISRRELYSNSSLAHSGSWFYYDQCAGSGDSINQTFSTVAGDTYIISFWLTSDSCCSGTQIAKVTLF